MNEPARSRAQRIEELVLHKLRQLPVRRQLDLLEGTYLIHIKVWDDRNGWPDDVTLDTQEQRPHGDRRHLRAVP